ncbi:MAG: ATP-binding protein [Kangiellaceae bacterium]|jgi:nitrogen fixation/metabolism regulation signal transduction histidine kinase|nr:ATP-binding protein [Kangiellaceae bacterium]
MTLKNKLLSLAIVLHLSLFLFALYFYQSLEYYLIAVEAILLISLVLFLALIKKAMQPLEYIEIFSSLLNEHEFTARFSQLEQSELDKLIEQFNLMLTQLYQERLAIGEQRGVFDKLMSESPIGVVLLDFENRITEINPSAEVLLNLTAADLEGKNLNQIELTKVKYLQQVKINEHKLITAEQGRRIKIGHYRIRDRGFERSFYMIQEMTGEIIQSQKSAYEKLIRLMSHEVNNTIAITNSLLESCLHYQDQLSDDARSDFADAINIVINRCVALNKFMQGYSNIVKLAKPIKTNFNFTKLIKDLTTLYYSECRERNITINFNPIKDYFINADASLIEQALINVIKNAIESIESDGEINIELTQQSDSIQLLVEDSGAGISAEQEAYLFTPFYTSKESGQGVGLMLVWEIFSMHDYQFSLSNRKQAKGAAFSLIIEKVI